MHAHTPGRSHADCSRLSSRSRPQLLGFGYGWYVQSFWATFLFCCGGLALSTLVCVPDWPFWNRHPLPWQPAEVIPGETKNADGTIIPDTNEHCGTCACGASVHGIHCESHPANKDKPAAAVTTTGDATDATTAGDTTAAAATAGPAAVEIQEVKVRGSKKK